MPANGSWEVVVDTVPSAVISQYWQIGGALRLLITGIPAVTPVVTVELLNVDNGLICTFGRPVRPFGPTDVPKA